MDRCGLLVKNEGLGWNAQEVLLVVWSVGAMIVMTRSLTAANAIQGAPTRQGTPSPEFPSLLI